MSEKEQPQKKQETREYFFPNTKHDAPFSCEAASEKEAIQANQEYLKQQKDNN